MNLVDRAKNMIVTPKTEWEVVAAETTPQAELLTTYVLPLAGLSAIAGFIGMALIGVAGLFRVSIMVGLGLALWQIVGAVISCFVIGFIIDALAPTFGGQKNSLQAFKVAVFAYTPAWVGGVFQIIPILGSLIAVLGGLYAIYLLYLGLPRLMKSPEDKAIAYTLVVIVCAIVISFVIGAIGGMFMTAGMIGRGVLG
jgi:hypothetical protein